MFGLWGAELQIERIQTNKKSFEHVVMVIVTFNQVSERHVFVARSMAYMDDNFVGSANASLTSSQ